MPTLAKKAFSLIAIASSIVSTIFYTLPTNAQTNLPNRNSVEDWELESVDDWSFSSEEEPISVKDDIKELEEYNLSESDSEGAELVEENRRWGNRGDVEDYSLEVEVYDY